VPVAPAVLPMPALLPEVKQPVIVMVSF